MIVEDQKMIRSLLESYIRKEPGYRVVFSVSGAGLAPELCKEAEINLILMDVQTEHRENGLSAVQKIKVGGSKAKIVVVTSLVDFDVLKKAKAFGADSLWYKDTDEETLMDVIRRTMSGEHIFPDAPPEVEIGTARARNSQKRSLSSCVILFAACHTEKLRKKWALR